MIRQGSDEDAMNFINEHNEQQQRKKTLVEKELEDLDDDLLKNQASQPGSSVNRAAQQSNKQQPTMPQQVSQQQPDRQKMNVGTPLLELTEMDLDLFNRLLKTGVLKANPNIKTDLNQRVVVLDRTSTERYSNGIVLASYLVVLKNECHKVNQDLAVDSNIVKNLKDQSNAQSRLFNWNFLCSELDKIGILIESDTKSLYVAGDSEEIGKLFQRIERFIVRISGDENILSFQNFKQGEDRKYDEASSAAMKQQLSNGRNQPTQKKTVKDGVDIMQMDCNREPSQTESTLEFILNTLCRALQMKPKQAAALLTNNNQFLIHCVVKGVKSRFEPMINWYQEVYQYSRHLSMMLEIEVENSVASGDQKMVKAAQQNFEKVLQTISCGCYSNNIEVSQLCMKTVSCIAADFAGNVELASLAMKWFQSKDNGIYTINYALRKHHELAEDFVTTVGNFTAGGEPMIWTYTNTLQGFYPDTVEYFASMATLFPFLALKFQKEMVEQSLLTLIIEKCIRFTDLDPSNTSEIRIASITLLTEAWLTYSSFIDKNPNFVSSIQHVYKKNVRDRVRSVRLVTATQMFKLLDKFSAEKNSSAPFLYKTLIFSLVESPQDQSSRELFLTNFQYLFENTKSIPVGLLIDPFVKSNQVQDNFQFQTFDFDFFQFIARHPKLVLQNAIQILDLLARLYLNDVCNASAAAVPFVMICSRFLDNIQCQEFILKFITISLNQLLQISQTDVSRSTGQMSPTQKILALPAPGESRSVSQMKNDFRIKTNKQGKQKEQIYNRIQQQDDEVVTRLKKSLIITILLKIQNLRVQEVNNALKDMVLGAQKQYKDSNNGYLNNGLMAVLKYWDDPDHLFNQYLKKMEILEKKQMIKRDQMERKMLEYGGESAAASAHKNLRGSLASDSMKNLHRSTAGRRSTALMPVTQNETNLRAMREIEEIKLKMKEEHEQKLLLHQKELNRQTYKDEKLKEELKKRRVEMGVQSNIKGVKQELKALIFKEDPTAKRAKNTEKEQIQLVDLNEEEDRDREILNQFMKKYGKIWKFMFQRYANQAYSTKGKKDFDDMLSKTSQINVAEVTNILKDHNTYPTLINKDEIQALIRLINMHSNNENSNDIYMLDYSQFLQLIPQIAFLCFSRPPIDKSHLPSVESLRALLNQWEQATRDRGKSTILFEDPDQSSFADKELIAALDQQLKKDPSYPVPEGFKKVVEKIPIYNYVIPACAKSLMSESQQICTQLMDDILFQKLDIHFLEPQVSFDIKTKVKPAIAKAKKKDDKSETLGYMAKADKKTEEVKEKKATALANMSAADKRKMDLEVKPKINLALKMQVTKQDLKNRPHYQEVAEVFEEMLQATEKGLNYLPPRLNRAPGQVHNEAKDLRQKRQEEEERIKQEKEDKRLERNSHVKALIKDTNYGGRDMPITEYKKKMTKLEKQEKEQRERAERKEFQQKTQESTAQMNQMREKNIEELKIKKEQEQREAQLKKEAEDRERKEFMALAKKKLQEQFEDTYKRRDKILTQKEAASKLEKDNEARLKAQIQDMISKTKEDRENEKLERKELDDFMKKEEISAIFKTYEKQLYHMYTFYASMDLKKENTFDLEYLHSMLNIREFIRFGYQQKLIPNFISPDDMVLVYKQCLSESQDKAQEKNDKQSIANRTSGMVDFGQFQKAIVRISIMAQEKLGGVNQDLLKQKLDKDRENNQQLEQQKKQAVAKATKKEQKSKQEMEQLRQQFLEEQKYKAENLSKRNKGKEDNKPDISAMTLQRQERLRQLELDEQTMNQEEEFFQKWLKARENLGTEANKLVAPATSDRKTSTKAPKPKDLTQKQLDELNAQMKKEKTMKNYTVEKRAVRKPLSVNIITAQTIEAFIQYLDITEEDTGMDLNKKLNASMVPKTHSAGEELSQKYASKKTQGDDDLARAPGGFNSQSTVKK